mgnify:CR=1 FL=1
MRTLKFTFLTLLHGVIGTVIGYFISSILIRTRPLGSYYPYPSIANNPFLEFLFKNPGTMVIEVLTFVIAYTLCNSFLKAHPDTTIRLRAYRILPHSLAIAVTSNIFTAATSMDQRIFEGNIDVWILLHLVILISSVTTFIVLCRCGFIAERLRFDKAFMN